MAIVNSKSYSIYTDVLKKLKNNCDVSRFDVPRDINGEKLARRLMAYLNACVILEI